MAENKSDNNNITNGVLSVVFSGLSYLCFGIILAPLGIIFGAIGLSQKNGNVNKTLSAIGLTLGIIAIVIIIAAFGVLYSGKK